MKLAREEGAQAIAEFALMLPLILLIVTGLFDLARAVWQENTLAFATREGSRYAIVHGSASTAPTGPPPLSDQPITDTVLRYTVGLSNITVTTAWPGTGS